MIVMIYNNYIFWYFIERFMQQIKDKKIKNFSLDQTIEEIFDKNDYENKLENII